MKRRRPKEPKGYRTPLGLNGPWVLVVDDERHAIRLIQSNLERYSYQVRTAKNGIQALASIRETYPDLLITDVMMPEMDSFELIEKIRSDPDLATIPIIVLAPRSAELGYQREHNPEACCEQSVYGARILWKPFNPSELVKIVREMLPDSNLNVGSDS